MSPPTVSIVLPARDAAATVGAAIASCRAQSMTDFELIVVDHGSLDDTGEILRAHAGDDERITVLARHRTTRFVDVLNDAWRLARGELVARMDADDLSDPERLETQCRFLREHPGVGACGTLVRIRRRSAAHGEVIPADDGYAHYERWLNAVVSPERIAAERFVDSPLANPSAMMRRGLLERLGGYRDPEWAEDYDFWLRALEAGERLGKVGRVLLDWFDSPARATRREARYSQPRFLQAKAHYLARVPAVRARGVTICGAGPIGKRLARHLRGGHGIEVGAFLEVSGRRIGNRIEGVPVRPWDRIGDAPRRVLVGAVGLRGARERIRTLALGAGYEEGVDFFCVA